MFSNSVYLLFFLIFCLYAGLSLLTMQSKGMKGLIASTILGWIVCSLVLDWFLRGTGSIFLVILFSIWLPLLAMSFSTYGTYKIFPQISRGALIIRYAVTVIIGVVAFPGFAFLLVVSLCAFLQACI